LQEQKLASEVNESGFTVNTPSLHVFDGRQDGYSWLLESTSAELLRETPSLFE